jgi:type IV pilus assembly protein PilN
MIKINLLPLRASKKKESTRQLVSILVISLAGVLAVGLSLYFLAIAKISATTDEIARSEQEIQQLKAKIGQIDNIKKLQAEVKKKLDVLTQLRKEKTGPANRLAKLSEAVPDKLWLVKYTENLGTVSSSGFAINEEIIATFMRNLQAAEEFDKIELQVSEQAEVAGVKVKRFDITFNIKSIKKDEPAKPDTK